MILKTLQNVVTLNQRVQGSSPCAPTNDFKYLCRAAGGIWNGLIVFQFLFAIGFRRHGGALQLADRGAPSLVVPPR
jgi:hypothetical protein